MSPALCCRMTSTSERLSTRSRMSSVRACSCWGVLGISMLRTSLATASMLSRSALSSTGCTHDKDVSKGFELSSLYSNSHPTAPSRSKIMEKIFLPQTSSKSRCKNRFLRVKLPSEKRPSQRVGPAGIALGSLLKISVISYTVLGLGEGDANPQERKPTAAHKCNCATSTQPCANREGTGLPCCHSLAN